MTATLTPSPQTPAAWTAGVPIFFTPQALSYSRSKAWSVTSGSTVLTPGSLASCLSWPFGTRAASPSTRASFLSTLPPYFSIVRSAAFPGGPWNVTMTLARSTTGWLAAATAAGARSPRRSEASTGTRMRTEPRRPADRDMDRSPSSPDRDGSGGVKRTPPGGRSQGVIVRFGAATHRPIVMSAPYDGRHGRRRRSADTRRDGRPDAAGPRRAGDPADPAADLDGVRRRPVRVSRRAGGRGRCGRAARRASDHRERLGRRRRAAICDRRDPGA